MNRIESQRHRARTRAGGNRIMDAENVLSFYIISPIERRHRSWKLNSSKHFNFNGISQQRVRRKIESKRLCFFCQCHCDCDVCSQLSIIYLTVLILCVAWFFLLSFAFFIHYYWNIFGGAFLCANCGFKFKQSLDSETHKKSTSSQRVKRRKKMRIYVLICAEYATNPELKGIAYHRNERKKNRFLHINFFSSIICSALLLLPLVHSIGCHHNWYHERFSTAFSIVQHGKITSLTIEI